MHDTDDQDFWSRMELLDVSRWDLLMLHTSLIDLLRSEEHEEIAEIMTICEYIEYILIRSGALTKEEIDAAHEEIGGDE